MTFIKAITFRTLLIFVFSVLVLNITLKPAMATHENDHRFKIYGVVKGEDGKPLKDSKVQVVVVRIDEGVTVFTDSTGYYETTLHMHDSNLGDEILITAIGVTKKITADFVAGDRKTERTTEVNFGSSTKSSSGSTGADNYMIYGIVGVIIIGGIFLIVSKGGKKEKGTKNKPK